MKTVMRPLGESEKERLSQLPERPFSVRAQMGLATCACVGASVFLYAVDPSRHAVYPQCLLYDLTGIYCAGCGATRALHALLHGQVLQALHDNALFVIALPLLLFVIGSYGSKAWHENLWPEIVVNQQTVLRRGIGLLLVMLIFMVLRNLSGWPFDLLKPLTS